MMGTLGAQVFKRCFSLNHHQNYKVAVIGASGGIGQPLSLLLKNSSLIDTLVLYDLAHVKGVTADISHIDTRSRVIYYEGKDKMKDAIKGCHLVVVSAGVPRKPGMTRDDLFRSNAIIAKIVAETAANVNPEVFIHMITNPVNAMIPIVCATYEKLKKGNPKHIFGITTLDLIRASTFVGEAKKLDPSKVKVPVIGGHAGETIIPLLSQTQPKVSFSKAELKKLTNRIQNGGTEVVEAKAGKGSATLSTAFAGARTAVNFLRALKGEPNIQETCYIKSNVTKSKYFSTPLILGKNGVEKNLGIPSGITDDEKKQIDKAIQTLAGSIKKGEDFAKK